MSRRHVWGLYPPQTTSNIHIRHTKCFLHCYAVSRILGAPLYHHSSQVDPRFVELTSLVEWEWYHILMVEIDIHLRLLHTFILDIYKGLEPLLCCLNGICVPLCHSTGKVVPRIGNSGLLVEGKWCHNVMFEADIHLRSLQTSILDIPKVFEPLVCCHKGIWVHPDAHAITAAKLAPDLERGHHLWSENDAIVFEADIHLWLLHTFIKDIYKVLEPLLCCLKGICVHPYTNPLTKLSPELGILDCLWSENDAITSCLRLISTSDHFKHPY